MALLEKTKRQIHKTDLEQLLPSRISQRMRTGEILEMIMEIQMEIHLGIIMETGRITLVVHHLAELEVLAGMMDLVRLIII